MPRTLLVVLTILALLAVMTVVFTQRALAAPPPFTVFATTQDCMATAEDKQLDWSGNDSLVMGTTHSNAGYTISGNNNEVTGAVTFNDAACDFVESGTNNQLGPTDAAIAAAPVTPSSYPIPGEGGSEPCTFSFTGNVDLQSEDVWLDPGKTLLKPGVYCVTGTDAKLQQSGQNVSGTVSFYSTGHIDLANGSDTDLTPFRADGILLYSTADGFDAVTVAGSGSDVVDGNSDHSFYRGIVFAPNGEAETGGQHITIGCIEAETVKLNGSNHIISGCGEGPPPPPQPLASLTKTNNTTGPVAPGSTVGFTITIDVTNGPVPSMTIVDQLPTGIGSATSIVPAGTYDAGTNRITWNLTGVADNTTLTYNAVVSATAAPGNYVNVATITQGPCVGDGCDDDSTVVVPPPTVTLTPTLVIDKTANTTSITISGPAAAQVATPSSVTWTLNYTLTNGPVTNAVITDPVPVGFDFVSATNGGTFNAGTRTITWNLASPLTTSGSVSFVTNVNLGTISRTGPTVNVATIDSTETAPDTGQDDVTVSVVAPPLASTGGPGTTTTPGSSALPNTALEIGPLGVMTIPLALLAMLLLGSLGALGYANVRSVKRRQR